VERLKGLEWIYRALIHLIVLCKTVRYRFKTKGLAKEIKFLKRLRARRARKNISEWRKTYAWEVS
jgi:hypothetical protein